MPRPLAQQDSATLGRLSGWLALAAVLSPGIGLAQAVIPNSRAIAPPTAAVRPSLPTPTPNVTAVRPQISPTAANTGAVRPNTVAVAAPIAPNLPVSALPGLPARATPTPMPTPANRRIQACLARYPNYDQASDTYVDQRGRRQRCDVPATATGPNYSFTSNAVAPAPAPARPGTPPAPAAAAAGASKMSLSNSR